MKNKNYLRVLDKYSNTEDSSSSIWFRAVGEKHHKVHALLIYTTYQGI